MEGGCPHYVPDRNFCNKSFKTSQAGEINYHCKDERSFHHCDVLSAARSTSCSSSTGYSSNSNSSTSSVKSSGIIGKSFKKGALISAIIGIILAILTNIADGRFNISIIIMYALTLAIIGLVVGLIIKAITGKL